jgi:hypothetical protein
MRWDRLFDDLEGQLEHELGAEEVDLGAEEERLRLGRLSLRDRLVAIASSGTARDGLRLELRDGQQIVVREPSLGRDWIAGPLATTGGPPRSAVVPLAAVTGVLPDPEQLAVSLTAEPAGEAALALSARLGLPFVLRDLCRRRTPVDLSTSTGARHGTIDRVSRDHLDLAEHEPGVPRRSSAVTRIRLVATEAVDLIRY